MAKIERHKDKDNKEHTINTETGEVTPVPAPVAEPWTPKRRIDFEKCKLLVDQIVKAGTNIVDETNLTTIANALATFGEKGRDLFNQVCVHQTQYDSDALKDYFDRALRTAKYNSATKFLNICVQFGYDSVMGDDEYQYLIVEGTKPVFFTDKIDDSQVRSIQEHGFMEMRNQYYFAEIDRVEKKITLTPKSNFTIRVLYHIRRGKSNKRVIAIHNNRNEKHIMEIETKEINSLASFKGLTEGAGNFVVNFAFTDKELQRVKNKIFSEEKTSQQLEVLGWDDNGFFAFANGLYDVTERKFHAVDEYGIVKITDTHYHIPFHPGTDKYSFTNEKKILYEDGRTNFKEWSSLYYNAFGMVGATVLVFTCSTIFSDHIFGVKNNFPMLFLYGEGGSGKGTVCEFAQYLFGHPQPPLKLTEKANTDKARVRKFATYNNMPVRLEEFSNSIDMAGIKTITNLYDRFGYERSSMETRYGTETVPIRSTVMITGNEYPADDPLMQRMILQDSDRNSYNDAEIKAFRGLQKLNQGGITCVLIELLNMRKSVEETWRGCYELEYDNMRNECKGIDVPSRMIENYSVLLATMVCLDKLGIHFPVSYDVLRDYFKSCLTTQAEKRNTGAVVQKFWDIVLSLARKNFIHHEREFLLDGKYLYIRFKEVHSLYMEEHLRIYRSAGLLSATMLQKLKVSGGEAVTSKRFGKVNTSCIRFEYLPLNIDLLYIINQKLDFANKELIESESEMLVREENERKLKEMRNEEIYNQAQEAKANYQAPPDTDNEDMPF